MGLTLSRFSECYRALNDVRYESVFDKVKMTCIVCNYSWNKSFAKKICHNEELCGKTGKNMLYVAFDGNTKSEWGRFGYMGSSDDQKYQCMANEGTFDNEGVIGIIRKYIDYCGDDSFIIISTNVRDREILVMHTSTKLIEKQLVELGRYCTESDDVNLNDPRIAEISDVYPFTLPQSLLEVLTNVAVLNERANCNSKHFLNDSYSRNYADNILENLRSISCDDLKKEDLIAMYQRLLRLADFYRETGDFGRHNINCRYQEYGIYKFSQYIDDLGGNVRLNCINYQHDLDNVDSVSRAYYHADDEKIFSRPITSLYQIVQETINYTATQYIRKCLGIPMPEFFFRWCDQHIGNPVIDTRNESVKFNLRDQYNNWRGPELGKFRCALDVIGRKNMFQNEMERYWAITNQTMLDLLDAINIERNYESHNGNIIDETKFQDVYNSFNRFTDFVPMLLEMKNSLFVNREVLK